MADVLQGLVDEYQVNEFSVSAGRNVFARKDVGPDAVEKFKNKYCTGLVLAEADVRPIEDDLAGILEMDTGLQA